MWNEAGELYYLWLSISIDIYRAQEPDFITVISPIPTSLVLYFLSPSPLVGRFPIDMFQLVPLYSSPFFSSVLSFSFFSFVFPPLLSPHPIALPLCSFDFTPVKQMSAPEIDCNFPRLPGPLSDCVLGCSVSLSQGPGTLWAE